MHKFEKLEIWTLALGSLDLCYEVADRLPKHERWNLGAQLRRAATSVALNIAEGSTGQTDAEQMRFLGMALRSLLETVACEMIVGRRKYVTVSELLNKAYADSEKLARKIQAMRRAIRSKSSHGVVGPGEQGVNAA
jgi:four helix bundle protein